MWSGGIGCPTRRSAPELSLYMAHTPPLADRFRDHLGRGRLFPGPGTALVAVSGGGDSVALLDLLHAVAAEHGLVLVVAHADHQIQPGSDGVARQVRDL